jgi:hypothetical protein
MSQILLRTLISLLYIVSICHGFISNTALLKKTVSAPIDLEMYTRRRFTAKITWPGWQNSQQRRSSLQSLHQKQGKSVTAARMSVSDASDAIVQFVVEHPLQDFIALVFFKFAYDAVRDGAPLPIAFVAGSCTFLLTFPPFSMAHYSSCPISAQTRRTFGVTQRDRHSRQVR